MAKKSEVITGMIPSVMRRAVGAGVLYALGFLLLYVAVAQPPSELHFLALLVIFGGVCCYGGYNMWRVTGQMIELSEAGLFMSDGTVIALLDDIHKVDRSFFAFKPSNGFLITLKKPYPRGWAPGLWWRIGKRVGVGGMTPGASGKIMADTLSAMIAERDGLVDLSDLKTPPKKR